MPARYTPRQGQHLAFIYHYTKLNGRPPAEQDMQRYFRVSTTRVHQVILNLEERGCVARTPGVRRSVRVLLPPEELPEPECPLIPLEEPRRRCADFPSARGESTRQEQAVKITDETSALRRLKEDDQNHPDPGGESEAVAQSCLNDTASGEIAGAVERAILELYLEDLDRYPGFGRYDSLEPTNAAWWVLREAVGPFVENIQRQSEAGQVKSAVVTCTGVVLGLYRLRDCKRGELLEYATDFPKAMAEETLSAVRKALRVARTLPSSDPSSATLPATLREAAPEWGDMLERCWRRPA
jgi:repressor LexA